MWLVLVVLVQKFKNQPVIGGSALIEPSAYSSKAQDCARGLGFKCTSLMHYFWNNDHIMKLPFLICTCVHWKKGDMDHSNSSIVDY